MNLGRTVFSQLVEFIPTYQFQTCVDRYQANRYVKDFSCWDQFLCLVFAQLTYRESLRDIEACLRAQQPKLYHMGFRGQVSRNTLAHANEVRDWRIYADFAQVLIGMARHLYRDEPFSVELSETVYALDSTTIDLCLSLFPWGQFRRRKSAVKLHTLLDLRGSIPTNVYVTGGQVHDVNLLDELLLVVAGDFNGDGNRDLAVTNVGDNTVSILLGNSDGTFQNHVDYMTGTDPEGVVAGDFNGDGKLDLAVVGRIGNAVSILLGNGDGTFQAHTDFDGGLGPFSPVTGDFNGDGKLDLAVVGGYQLGTVSVLLGNGDGTFQGPVSYATGPYPYSMAAADLNGDGKLDLVVASNDANNTVSVLLGNGDGTFQPQVTYAMASRAVSVAIGDFNGDGKLDLAVNPSGSGLVSILLGNGDGSFQPTTDFTLPGECGGRVISMGDLNNDGRPDLLQTGNAVVCVTLQVPVVTLSGTSLSFGSQSVGTTTASQTVTVTNSGSAPLRVSSIALTGDNSGDFAETNNCGSGVAAGASCAINVTFTPGAVGARAAAIQFTDNAPDSPQSITLSGTGLGVLATLSPPSLTFGSQLLATPITQTVTLSNTGNQALKITSVAITGPNSSDFAQTNDCGTSVAAGASCTISVTFTPSARGARSATLAVSDNASGSPQTVALSGTGISPVVSASPASLTFPSQFVGTTGLPQNVTVSNTGEVALTISSVQASADFGETSGCTSSLAPGVSCTVGVFFDPSASGSRSGTLTITDNAPGSPHTVALSGTGQDFTFSATSTTATIAAGQTATYNLAVAPAGGLSQTVTLACAGAPALATCSVPAMVTLNGSSATAVAVTVTTASTMTPPGGRSRWPSWPASLRTGLPWPMMMLALMLLASIERRYRSGGHALPRGRVALGTLTLLVTLWTAACGGGGSSVVHNPGTPAGAYTLTVTATVTSGSATLQHAEKLGLAVQ